MKIAPPKYTRDFYPEEMRRREWIEGAWHAASRSAGFLPWDGPILETLELYKRKSGEEIVEQLFNIASKGSQELAVRPEMTPSLARMIVTKQSSLPRPIKWYTIGRMCRYERGQRGRLREFWQWNVDVLGVEGTVADAEVISVAIDGLENLGLTDADVGVHLNSRRMLSALLIGAGIEEALHGAIYAVADKRSKLPTEEIDKLFAKIGLPESGLAKVKDLFRLTSLDELQSLAREWADEASLVEVDQLRDLFDLLAHLGKEKYCRFDIGIVRGLAYYTGPVFEILDVKGELRAIGGGGRYDRLMETMGGQAMPACGFGMGDVTLGELLTERNLSPASEGLLDDFIIPVRAELIPDMLKLVARRRKEGRRVDYFPKPGNRDKLLKRAIDTGARHAILIGGPEWDSGRQVLIRDLQTRTETIVPFDGSMD
ncbi:histidine--tRNA ligase [bacterium]|nr:histidine--tRNA ligase [bacterium]